MSELHPNLHRNPLIAGFVERWFGSAEPVMLARADGSFAVFRDGCLLKTVSDADTWSGTRALELDADSVALTSVASPGAPAGLWDQIIHTQVQALSPIDPAELVWGWVSAPQDSDTVDVVITTRSKVADQIDAARSWQADEIWAPAAGKHVVLRGFGEQARQQREVRKHSATVLALIVLLACLMLTSLAPLLAQRSQLNQAAAALVEMRAAARPALDLRDRSLTLSAELEYLSNRKDLSEQALKIIALMTLSLPDSAYLNRLEVEEGRVMASGQAKDAAALIEALGRNPAFGQLTTRGAITRDRDGRDAFNIEFDYRETGGQGDA